MIDDVIVVNNNSAVVRKITLDIYVFLCYNLFILVDKQFSKRRAYELVERCSLVRQKEVIIDNFIKEIKQWL